MSAKNTQPASATRVLFIGGNGHHYLRTLLPDRITGVCLTDPADPVASADWAARHDVERFDGGFDDAVQRFDPQVVSVGAVYNHNGRYVRAALRAGLPVVSDKPVAADESMLAEIQALATADGAPPLLTEFDWRARPALRAARLAFDAGQIGTLVLAVGQKSYRFGNRAHWYADPRHYCGTMMWVASHALDAIAFVSGSQPTVLSARGGNVSRSDFGSMEDHVVALLELPGGATGVIHADLINPEASPTHGKDRLRFVGAHGELLVEDDRCILTTNDAAPRDITDEVSQALPLAERLLAAALGQADPAFNTSASLATARLMLDAARAQQRINPPDGVQP